VRSAEKSLLNTLKYEKLNYKKHREKCSRMSDEEYGTEGGTGSYVHDFESPGARDCARLILHNIDEELVIN